MSTKLPSSVPPTHTDHTEDKTVVIENTYVQKHGKRISRLIQNLENTQKQTNEDSRANKQTCVPSPGKISDKMSSDKPSWIREAINSDSNGALPRDSGNNIRFNKSKLSSKPTEPTHHTTSPSTNHSVDANNNVIHKSLNSSPSVPYRHGTDDANKLKALPNDAKRRNQSKPELPKEHVLEVIRDYVLQHLNPGDTHKILDQLENAFKGSPEYEIVQTMNQTINNFHIELRNMYDNYLFFDTDRDKQQLKRFMRDAYQRAKNRWEEAGLISEGFSLDLLGHVRMKFVEYFGSENTLIIKNEMQLSQAAKSKIIQAYNAKMEEYTAEKKGKFRRSELQAAHARMLAQINQIIGKSFSYGAKFNNVVFDASKEIHVKLDKIFKEKTKSMNFISDEPPMHTNIIGFQGESSQEHFQLKMSLIKKCNKMEEQINEGRVQVPPLTRRIIMDAIAQGRLAAQEDMVKGNEAAVLEDLFKTHNFK